MTLAQTDRKYFVDVFEDWMTEVRALYDLTSAVEPYSYYGTVPEIIEYLVGKDNNPDQIAKYPLVCLIDDMGLKPKVKLDWYEVNPTFYIFTNSAIDSDPETRYEEVVKPILFAIMEYMKEVIEFSECVSEANESTEPEYEIFKGSIDGKPIIDTVDCIKFSYQNLRIKNLY